MIEIDEETSQNWGPGILHFDQNDEETFQGFGATHRFQLGDENDDAYQKNGLETNTGIQT